MKKFILITAMVLVSAAAHAGPSRSLTLASNETPAPAAAPQTKAVEPAKSVEPLKSVEPAKATETPTVPCATTTTDAKPADTPKFVERPAPVEPTSDQPNLDAKPVATTKASKPKSRHGWSEARIIGELHRYGVYW